MIAIAVFGRIAELRAFGLLLTASLQDWLLYNALLFSAWRAVTRRQRSTARRRRWISLATSALAICPGLVALTQRSQTSTTSPQQTSLKAFLQSYLRTPPLEDDKTTRYFTAFLDLNGDGVPEVIVYLTGQSWCGTGGCPTLVLTRNRLSYSVLTKVTLTRPPIRVLTNSSHGWRSLAVWVQGGGIQPGYEAELEFDGKTYPSNPSTFPAHKLTARVTGKVVLDALQVGTLLYP